MRYSGRVGRRYGLPRKTTPRRELGPTGIHQVAPPVHVNPLSYVQVNLLKRFRALSKDSAEREEMVYPLLLIISAISSGMLSTG